MKLILNRTLILGLFLFFLVICGVILRNFPFTNGNLDDYKMPIITSTDVAFHAIHSKVAYDTGLSIFELPFSTGGIENTLTEYPPLQYTFFAGALHMTSLLAKVSPYQVIYLLICLLAVLAPLYGFLIIRRYFSLETALIVLALSLIPATLYLFPIYIGFWADVFAYAPAIAALFFMKELWHGRSILPLFLFAILSSAAAIGHAYEFMYPLFLICLTVLFLIIRKLDKLALRNLIIAVLIMSIPLYFFLVRFDIAREGGGATFLLGQVRSGPPDYFPHVSFDAITTAATVLGAIVILLMFLQKKITPYQTALILFPVFVVAIVLGRYIGIENMQTYRQLYHSHFFLLLPAAIGISGVLSFLKQKIWARQISIGIILILLALIAVPTFSRTYSELSQSGGTLAPKYAEWDSLMWIRDNTPKDSKILTLFGIYGQSFELFSERQSTWYPPENTLVLEEICNGTLPAAYNYINRVYWITPDNPYLVTLNKDLSITKFRYNTTWVWDPKPLEAFDYILLRYKGTQVDPCMQFYASEMLKRGHTLAWNDDQVLILKVNKNATRTN